MIGLPETTLTNNKAYKVSEEWRPVDVDFVASLNEDT